MFMSASENAPTGSERREFKRKEMDLNVEFRFVFPLASIITRMFGIPDSGVGLIKNISKGGIMLEIPVTVKELTLLSRINKSLESDGVAPDSERFWPLKSTDFSTLEIVIPDSKNISTVSLLALPVWARYCEYNQTGGAIKIGLKFPENISMQNLEKPETLKSILSN